MADNSQLALMGEERGLRCPLLQEQCGEEQACCHVASSWPQHMDHATQNRFQHNMLQNTVQHTFSTHKVGKHMQTYSNKKEERQGSPNMQTDKHRDTE